MPEVEHVEYRALSCLLMAVWHQFLKNPGMYRSVSAFAPIANPSNSPWGQKAFKGYLGEDEKEPWKAYDATELVKNYKGKLDALIDVVCFIVIQLVSCSKIRLLSRNHHRHN
jgi:hypothetical protein